MKRSLFFWIGCATLLSTNCKTNNANLKDRNQDFAATNDQFENDPYGLNDIKNFAIDFDSLAKAEWEGDVDSGITGKWSKSLKQLKDSDFAKMKSIFCGTDAGCDDFDKTYALFFANSALPSPENPSPEANWVGDQMFTKAINAKGEHVRVRPYIRAIPYDPYNEANPQKSASRLKEVMRPGDIIVFWHPEMNDFGEMVRRGDAEYAMKEMVKFRSTHAGLAWYDGDKIWSVNSPQAYHKGWFDETSKYPFHIFRIVPNSKGSVKFSIPDRDLNKKISTVNYGCSKPPCSYTKRDAIAEYFSLYALGMSNYFDFPGDYNGGDPLNLFHTSLIDSYHKTWTSDNFLPGMDGIRFTGGEYTSVRGSEQNMAQIYCAEFVWMAGSMALSKKLPTDFSATEF
ncbi:MAG: hypothetical protein NT027_01910, partial [Proteobacteria bacterium]|nr:hypothetical protein [Pseudomonadota bacterium]